MTENRMSLLEQMRVQRDQREEAVSAPLTAQIVRAEQQFREARATLRSLEKALGSKMADHVIKNAADEVRRLVMREVYQATMKIDPVKPVPVTITFEPGVIRFLDPRSIESRILQEYTSRTMPDMSVRADVSAKDMVTTIDVRIPPLGYRTTLMH